MHLPAVDEDIVNDHIAVVTKTECEPIYHVRRVLNSRIWIGIVEAQLAGRIVDLHDSIFKETVTQYSVNWFSEPGGQCLEVDRRGGHVFRAQAADFDERDSG